MSGKTTWAGSAVPGQVHALPVPGGRTAGFSIAVGLHQARSKQMRRCECVHPDERCVIRNNWKQLKSSSWPHLEENIIYVN